MAQIAIRLPVFLASPSDVAVERGIAEEEILRLAREAARHRLLLEPFRWETDAQPGIGRPNEQTNRFLKMSELAVIIFWSSLGSASTVDGIETGTVEELHLSWRQVSSGASDDLFVYFRNADPPGERREDRARVRDFRTQLVHDKSLYFFDYGEPQDFRALFSVHLRRWIERWYSVPSICEFALDHEPPRRMPSGLSAETRLHNVRRRFDETRDRKLAASLGGCAVELYQRYGPEGFRKAIMAPGKAMHTKFGRLAVEDPKVTFLHQAGAIPLNPTPLTRLHDGSLYFADREWFCYFCALGLKSAITENATGAVEDLPYVNDVHQYLAVLVDGDRSAVTTGLSSWLVNKGGVTSNKPVARNFAAYALGMLQAHEAQDALAEAALHDRGFEVDRYAIAALGKLRARRHLSMLVELFHSTPEKHRRIEISQAICKMSGVADYEL